MRERTTTIDGAEQVSMGTRPEQKDQFSVFYHEHSEQTCGAVRKAERRMELRNVCMKNCYLLLVNGYRELIAKPLLCLFPIGIGIVCMLR